MKPEMKYLTLIRHAKSSWSTPELDDIIRPLNNRGLESIHLIGNYLKLNKIKPDLILTSPATRALQTAIGICNSVNYKPENLQIEQEIYFGNSASIFKLIQKIDNRYNDIFLFGHEPILSKLIEYLTTNKLEKFPTCAVYRIAFDTKKWTAISAKISNCEFFVKPKDLLE